MTSELTIALITAGSAIAGALVGGAAAVWAATRAARSTYLGPLHVAHRTAQQQAYTALVSAANEYEARMGTLSGIAVALIYAENRRLPESTQQEFRASIATGRDFGSVRAAARLVTLAGPPSLDVEAQCVVEVARALSFAFRDAGTYVDCEDGPSMPAVTAAELRRTYDRLSAAIARFAVFARESGGHRGEAAAP